MNREPYITPRDILLDCDGVLCDFLGGCSDLIGRELDPDKWNFIDELPESECFSVYEACNDAHWWHSLEPYDHAQEAVERFIDQGHRITVVTSPWETCFGWANARARWLQVYFNIGWDQLVVTKCKHRVWGDVFVDDKPENVDDWTSFNPGRGLLWQHGFNKKEQQEKYPNMNTVCSWEDVAKELV